MSPAVSQMRKAVIWGKMKLIYVKLRSYYISTGTYINKYRFGELLFLFKNSNVEENKCAVDAMRTIAINAMNINLVVLMYHFLNVD